MPGKSTALKKVTQFEICGIIIIENPCPAWSNILLLVLSAVWNI